MLPCIYIVTPCYNEEEVLPLTAPVFLTKLHGLISDGLISGDSKVMFVNDGSNDKTWEIIEKIVNSDQAAKGVRLSHNSGEQNALIAGLSVAKDHSDAVITCDCDLQDDIHAIDEMISKFNDGFEIVYGVRSDRQNDPFLQRLSSGTFYKLMSKLDIDIIEEHSNFRLMSKRAIDLLMEFRETSTFLPALVKSVGLKYSLVYHHRFERTAGKSNYNFIKLFDLAERCIFYCSALPIKLLSVILLFSFLLFVISLVFAVAFSIKNQSPSLPLIINAILWFISFTSQSAVLIASHYCYRLMLQIKNRPRFQIEGETITDGAGKS